MVSGDEFAATSFSLIFVTFLTLDAFESVAKMARGSYSFKLQYIHMYVANFSLSKKKKMKIKNTVNKTH